MTDATTPDTDNTTPDGEQPTPPAYTPEELAAHYASLRDRPMPPPLDDDIARMAAREEQRDELLRDAAQIATAFAEFAQTVIPLGQSLLPSFKMIMGEFTRVHRGMVQAGLVAPDGEPIGDDQGCRCDAHTAPTPQAPPTNTPRPGYRDDLDKTQMVVIDGRDAAAAVVVRPATDGPPGAFTVEAMANGMDKEDAAGLLRQVSDMWMKEYAAEKAAAGAAAEEQLSMLKDLFSGADTEPTTDAAPDA